MSTTNDSDDMTIVPVKFIQKSLSEAGELSVSDSISEDNIRARSEYDSRVYSGVPLSDETSHYQLFTFFSFDEKDRSNDKQNDKLKTVYNWAKDSSKSNELIKIIDCLKDLEHRIGFPDLGETRLDKVYNYVNIERQIKDLEQEKFMKYGM